MLRHSVAESVLIALSALDAQAALPSQLNEQAIRSAALASFPDYLHFLTLPNISLEKGADLPANADWLQKQFEQRGFHVQQVANGGKPLLVAGAPAVAGKKTVLFYLHYDGQPVVPAQWAQASPWQPTLKRKGPDGQVRQPRGANH